MALNAFFNGLDDITTAGHFFVDLTRRLGDGSLDAGEDALRLSRVLGVGLPPELAGVSIVSLEDSTFSEAPEAAGKPGSARISIFYPSVGTAPGSIHPDLTFKKCFKVCKTVAGATVCAQVCVNLSIGLSGVSGNISATVSVAF